MQRETAETVSLCRIAVDIRLKERLSCHGTIKVCFGSKPVFAQPDFTSGIIS